MTTVLSYELGESDARALASALRHLGHEAVVLAARPGEHERRVMVKLGEGTSAAEGHVQVLRLASAAKRIL